MGGTVVGRGVVVWRGVAGSAVAVGFKVAVAVAVGGGVDVAVGVDVEVAVEAGVDVAVEVACGAAVAVAAEISTAVGVGVVLLGLAQAAKMIVPVTASAAIRIFMISPISQCFLAGRVLLYGQRSCPSTTRDGPNFLPDTAEALQMGRFPT